MKTFYALLLIAAVTLLTRASTPQDNLFNKFFGNKSELNQPENLFRSSAVVKLDSTYRWRYNPSTMNWDVKNRRIYQTDWQGNVLSYISQNWTVGWQNSAQYTYGYDANFNNTSLIVQTWDGSAWVNYAQRFTTFDSDNNIVQELIQNWNVNAWENGNQGFFWWNANRLDSGLLQEWNGSTWANASFMISNYDLNDVLMNAVFLDWDGSLWINEEKELYTYNTNGDMTELLSQQWNGQWDNDWREQYFYYSGFLNDQTDFASWNGTGWLTQGTEYYTYDVNEMIQSLVFDNASFKDSTQYYYTDVTAISENDFLNESFTIFPNPVQEILTIKTNTELNGAFDLSIIDLSGRSIYKTQHHSNRLNGNFSVDLSDLSPGIYFLRIEGRGRSIVKKIITE